MKRRKRKRKRPKGYWKNATNLENELRGFWKDAKLSIPPGARPPIPNESLLNRYERFDLRYAIYSLGGRERVSVVLGGAAVVPGKRKDALRFLGDVVEVAPVVKGKWAHKASRKPKGYWTEEVLLRELYGYLGERMKDLGRPCVYMPRPSEFSKQGRHDLRYAVTRFGGADLLCRKAGLIPYREWTYFESQYRLFLLLRHYFATCAPQDASFPTLKQLRTNRAYELLSLVQLFGGMKFIASKLDMPLPNTNPSSTPYHQLYWGPIHLDFVLSLLAFVREDLLMRQRPPLNTTLIHMPTQDLLITFGERGRLLIKDIQRFGGYENIARRLGLFFTL